MSESNSKHNKILIVGGGPSGLMLSIVLAESSPNLEITVIDKKEWPVDKVCGQGIMPGGIKLLKKYGIIDFIPKELQIPFLGVQYINQDGITAKASFNKGIHGIGIERIVLSNALLKKAQTYPNIKLQDQTKLVMLKPGDSFTPIIEKNGAQTTLDNINIIFGADGTNSQTKKFAQLESDKNVPLVRMGARIHYAITPWTNFVQVYWNNDIEVYVTPVSNSKVELAFLWNKNSPTFKNRSLVLEDLLIFFPKLQRELETGTPLEKLKLKGPLYSSSKSFINKNVILLGDAYYFYDAITAEGISLSLKQAILWGDYLKKFNFDYKKIEASTKEIRQTIVKSIIRPYNQLTHLTLLLNRFPLLRKIVIKIFQKFPKLFSALLNQKIIIS
ncbi:MAG: FAD-dependent monooxygenase [Bacteriovoracaceae bacterium]